MPALTNPKHERFAQGLFRGKTQIEAYIDAGYKADSGAANRLSGKVSIQQRIAEMQAASCLRVEVTLASLIQEAAEIQEAARLDKQYSAATSALTAKAKLAGLWVDKAENTNRNVDPARVSDVELAAIIQADSGEGTKPAPVNPSQLN